MTLLWTSLGIAGTGAGTRRNAARAPCPCVFPHAYSQTTVMVAVLAAAASRCGRSDTCIMLGTFPCFTGPDCARGWLSKKKPDSNGLWSTSCFAPVVIKRGWCRHLQCRVSAASRSNACTGSAWGSVQLRDARVHGREHALFVEAPDSGIADRRLAERSRSWHLLRHWLAGACVCVRAFSSVNVHPGCTAISLTRIALPKPK